MINFVKISTLNTYKKNRDYVFLIFFNYYYNNLSVAKHYIFTLFTKQIKFYWFFFGKKLKIMKTDNVHIKLKQSQIILEIVWCIENAIINIQ